VKPISLRTLRWMAGAAVFGVLFLATPSTPLHAQRGTLDGVEALAASGRVGDARVELEEWWQGGRADASRMERQRGIWLRGVLTVDPSLAELDFQRLALEFPGGPYTDMALTRLGHGAQARGDLIGAAGYFESVLRDYPGSNGAAEGERWLQRWDSQVVEARALARAAQPEQDPVIADASPPDPDATPEEILAPVEAETEHDTSGSYAVQLGAFRSVERARIVEGRAREAGLEARIVRVEGSDLVRIRVGWYETSRQATEVMREIRELGLEAAVVRDAQQERPAG